ncbi:MAG TPA: hypothetical protein VF585_01845, partial [Chthoniobacterales bacterium]
QKFTNHNSFTAPADLAAYPIRKAFYEELEKNHPLVFKTKPGVLKYLNPGLSLYRITPDPSPSAPQP